MKIHLKKLSRQVMVITGATSGVGLATARLAARRGARLVLAARNEQALAELVKELRDQSADAIYVVADVGQEEQVRNVAATAMRHYGRIDSWVNNAGVSIFGTNEQVATEDKRRLFETDFWGVVYGSLIAVEYLKRQGGALINVGSAFGDRAAPLQGIYSAAKHAVQGFTDSLRVELEQEGAPISVTLIKPASLATMLVRHTRNYLDANPRLPPPLYSPAIAAKAILFAAEHPRRELYVGGAARALSLAAHFAPGTVDKGMRWLMFRLHKTKQPTRSGEPDNLHGASKDLQEQSYSGGPVMRNSLYTSLVTHPKQAFGFLIGAALVGAGLLHAKRRQPSHLSGN